MKHPPNGIANNIMMYAIADQDTASAKKPDIGHTGLGEDVTTGGAGVSKTS